MRANDGQAPKSVLFVVHKLGNGGVGRDMVHYANGLANLGMRAEIATCAGEEDYLADVQDNVKVIDLKCRCRKCKHKLPLAMKIVGLSRDFDIVVSALEMRTDEPVIYAKFINSLLGRKKKYVATVHNAITSHCEFIGKLFPRLWWRCVYRWFDLVIPVSEGVRGDIDSIGGVDPAKNRALLNPVHVDHIREIMKQEIDLQSDRPFFVAVGRLQSQKDYPTLLRAFAEFRRSSGLDYDLIILGRGELESELKDVATELGISESVVFQGFVPNPWAYMYRSKALVLSSVHEGLSLVIAEAMACGTPVISTDCPYGPSELLGDGSRGRLVRVGDPDAIARAMIDLISQADETEQMKRAASLFIEELNLPVIVRKFYEMLSSV